MINETITTAGPWGGFSLTTVLITTVLVSAAIGIWVVYVDNKTP